MKIQAAPVNHYKGNLNQQRKINYQTPQVQVAFCAKNKGGFFSFAIPNSNKQEHYISKQTSEEVFKTYDFFGKLKEELRINPQTGTRRKIIYDKKGITKIATTAQTYKEISVKNSRGLQIYYEYDDKNGTRLIEQTDYDRNRMVRKTLQEGKEPSVEVISLFDFQNVYSGPMVEDKITGKDGITRIVNIITGQVYQTEEKLADTNELKIVDYSRETGKLQRITYKSRKESMIYEYNKDGILEKETFEDASGARTTTRFDKDGKTPISTVKHEFLKNSSISKKNNLYRWNRYYKIYS